MSNFIKHGACLKCNSSDARAHYIDGGTYCFSCKAKGSPTTLFRTGEHTSLPHRKLTLDTCRKYDYIVTKDNLEVANYYDKYGKVVAQKIRTPDKKFKVIGDLSKALLFGGHLFEGGEYITVTEGEIDALTFSQVNNNRFPVVSISTGAGGAYKQIQQHLEYFDKFNTVVFMFDNDEVGKEASHKCISLLPYGKAKRAILPYKDVSEAYLKGDIPAIHTAFFNARAIVPSGIIAGIDLWERIVTSKDIVNIDYPWACLNETVGGLRCGELVTITAGSGVGKTSFVKEIIYHLGCKKGYKIGLLMLEEDTVVTAKSIMSLHTSTPFHRNNNYLPKVFEETIGNGNVFLYDSWGSTTVENLINRVRYLTVGCCCSYIVLDHISLVISGIDTQNERKLLDIIMTKLRALVQETGICLILISHLRRIDGDKGHEQGAEVSLAHLRGSHSIAQLSDIVLALERNQQSLENPDSIQLRVLKNRYNGQTGLTGTLQYNKHNGRLNDATSF